MLQASLEGACSILPISRWLNSRATEVAVPERQPTPEPMWPTLLVLLATGALFSVMPDNLAIGPRWLLLALVAGLLLPAEVCHALGKHKWCRILGYQVITIVTAAMISSVVLLVEAIIHRTMHPVVLLHSAAILWVT